MKVHRTFYGRSFSGWVNIGLPVAKPICHASEVRTHLAHEAIKITQFNSLAEITRQTLYTNKRVSFKLTAH